jgi:hypothetical protein
MPLIFVFSLDERLTLTFSPGSRDDDRGQSSDDDHTDIRELVIA